MFPEFKKVDFRLYFAIGCIIVAAILLYPHYKKFIEFFYNDKVRWCFSFCLLGFSILVLKICINNKKPNPELKNTKKRYFIYYLPMLIVMSTISCIISINLVKQDNTFLASSALISFFLGYFIDSLSIIMEKLTEKLLEKLT